MQDQKILKIINDLKGRKNYEQKKESLKKTNTEIVKKKSTTNCSCC